MFIPNVNINAYRRQYQSFHEDEIQQILCNENVHNPRFIGNQQALVSGLHDEGALYRGYGAYRSNATCNAQNIYSPIYYNDKNTQQPNSYWYI